MGVYYDTQRKKYRAMFMYKGKKIHVGRYDTRLKATRALNKYRKDLEVTPLVGEGYKNVGVNGKGHIVPLKHDEPTEVQVQKHFATVNEAADEQELQDKLENLSYDHFMTNWQYGEAFPEPTPTLRDKLKALWPRKKRNDN